MQERDVVLAALLALTTIGTASPAQDGAPPEDAALALVRAGTRRRHRRQIGRAHV